METIGRDGAHEFREFLVFFWNILHEAISFWFNDRKGFFEVRRGAQNVEWAKTMQ